MILEKIPEDIVYERKMMMKTESTEEVRRCLGIIVSVREDANRATVESTSKPEIYTTENFHIRNTNNVSQKK